MKNCILFLFAFVLCVGCQKQIVSVPDYNECIRLRIVRIYEQNYLKLQELSPEQCLEESKADFKTMNEIFEKDLNIQLNLVAVIINPATPGEMDETIDTKLAKMPEMWKHLEGDYKDLQPDIVQMVSAYGFDMRIGLSTRKSLTEPGFSVIYGLVTPRVLLASHEIGHNLGANHDILQENIVGPAPFITEVYIMSPVLYPWAKFEFSPESKKEIRRFINGNFH